MATPFETTGASVAGGAAADAAAGREQQGQQGARPVRQPLRLLGHGILRAVSVSGFRRASPGSGWQQQRRQVDV